MRSTPQDSGRVTGEEPDPRGYTGTPWKDDQGRVRRPHITYYADDGTTAHGAEALGCFRRLCHASRTSSPTQVRPRAGRAPRTASNTKTRGSRRTSTGSRAGPDDPDSDEPPGGRLCACGCGWSIDHRHHSAQYLNDTHGDTHRKRVRRGRERAEDAGPRQSPTLPRAAWRVELLGELIQDGYRELMEGDVQPLTRVGSGALRPMAVAP